MIFTVNYFRQNRLKFLCFRAGRFAALVSVKTFIDCSDVKARVHMFLLLYQQKSWGEQAEPLRNQWWTASHCRGGGRGGSWAVFWSKTLQELDGGWGPPSRQMRILPDFTPLCVPRKPLRGPTWGLYTPVSEAEIQVLDLLCFSFLYWGCFLF